MCSSDLPARFPKKAGILHELGHGIGLNRWRSNMGARKYQTIGGSFQDYITAYDAKRLRDYYGNGDSAEFNFAAAGKFWKTPNGGQLLRFNRVAGESTLTARENEEHNTLKLYVSGNTLLDCRTDAAPLFGAGWFNNGAADVPGNQCFNNVLAIRKKSEPWKRIVKIGRAHV